MTQISGRLARTVAVGTAILATVVAGGYAPSTAQTADLTNARVAATASYPPTFVGAQKGRLGVFRSGTGSFVRYLTPSVSGTDVGLPSLTPDRKSVYFVRTSTSKPCPGTYRVPLAGGTVVGVRSGQNGGAQPIATGQPGVLAGTYACIASQYVHATAANKKSYNIGGVRDLGADGMSWAPDGYGLAVATLSKGVRYFDVRTTTSIGLGKLAPCPAGLTGCITHAPSYSPAGVLYYVAVKGTTAKVVRLSSGRGIAVFSLPRTSAHYSLAAASGGQLLASGDSNSASTTSSDFVVRWDGSARHSLSRTMIQVDW